MLLRSSFPFVLASLLISVPNDLELKILLPVVLKVLHTLFDVPQMQLKFDDQFHFQIHCLLFFLLHLSFLHQFHCHFELEKLSVNFLKSSPVLLLPLNQSLLHHFLRFDAKADKFQYKILSLWRKFHDFVPDPLNSY